MARSRGHKRCKGMQNVLKRRQSLLWIVLCGNPKISAKVTHMQNIILRFRAFLHLLGFYAKKKKHRPESILSWHESRVVWRWIMWQHKFWNKNRYSIQVLVDNMENIKNANNHGHTISSKAHASAPIMQMAMHSTQPKSECHPTGTNTAPSREP